MSGGSDMVSNSWRVIIFRQGLEIFSLPIMEPSLSFTDVKIITIPTPSFINDSGMQKKKKKDLIWQVFWKIIFKLTQSKSGKYRILGV